MIALFVAGVVASELVKIFRFFYAYDLVGPIADVLMLAFGVALFVALATVTLWVARRVRSRTPSALWLAALVGGGAFAVVVVPWPGIGVAVWPWPGGGMQTPTSEPTLEYMSGQLAVTLAEFPGVELAGPADCRVAQSGYVEGISGGLGTVAGGELYVDHAGVDRDGAASLGLSWKSPSGPGTSYVPDDATFTVSAAAGDGSSGAFTFAGLSLPKEPFLDPIGGPDGPRTLSGSVEWECET